MPRSSDHCDRSVEPPPDPVSASGGRLVVVDGCGQLGQQNGHGPHLPEEPHGTVRRAAAPRRRRISSKIPGLSPPARAPRGAAIASYTSGSIPRSSRAANLIGAQDPHWGSSRRRNHGAPISVRSLQRATNRTITRTVEHLPAIEVVEGRADQWRRSRRMASSCASPKTLSLRISRSSVARHVSSSSVTSTTSVSGLRRKVATSTASLPKGTWASRRRAR